MCILWFCDLEFSYFGLQPCWKLSTFCREVLWYTRWCKINWTFINHICVSFSLGEDLEDLSAIRKFCFRIFIFNHLLIIWSSFRSLSFSFVFKADEDYTFPESSASKCKVMMIGIVYFHSFSPHCSHILLILMIHLLYVLPKHQLFCSTSLNVFKSGLLSLLSLEDEVSVLILFRIFLASISLCWGCASPDVGLL